MKEFLKTPLGKFVAALVVMGVLAALGAGIYYAAIAAIDETSSDKEDIPPPPAPTSNIYIIKGGDDGISGYQVEYNTGVDSCTYIPEFNPQLKVNVSYGLDSNYKFYSDMVEVKVEWKFGETVMSSVTKDNPFRGLDNPETLDFEGITTENESDNVVCSSDEENTLTLYYKNEDDDDFKEWKTETFSEWGTDIKTQFNELETGTTIVVDVSTDGFTTTGGLPSVVSGLKYDMVCSKGFMKPNVKITVDENGFYSFDLSGDLYDNDDDISKLKFKISKLSNQTNDIFRVFEKVDNGLGTNEFLELKTTYGELESENNPPKTNIRTYNLVSYPGPHCLITVYPVLKKYTPANYHYYYCTPRNPFTVLEYTGVTKQDGNILDLPVFRKPGSELDKWIAVSYNDLEEDERPISDEATVVTGQGRIRDPFGDNTDVENIERKLNELVETKRIIHIVKAANDGPRATRNDDGAENAYKLVQNNFKLNVLSHHLYRIHNDMADKVFPTEST